MSKREYERGKGPGRYNNDTRSGSYYICAYVKAETIGGAGDRGVDVLRSLSAKTYMKN